MPPGLLALVLTAHGLTSHQSGPSLDLAAGLGIGDAPVAAMVGGQLSLGWWAGVYDDQYAFGRYWWFGATGRVDARSRGTRLLPMIEIRRGLELFLAGVSVGVAGGAIAEVPDDGEGDPFGWTARAHVQTKLRRTRFVGFSLRIEGGVDQMGKRTTFGGGVLLGISYARPAQPIVEPVFEAPLPTTEGPPPSE